MVNPAFRQQIAVLHERALAEVINFVVSTIETSPESHSEAGVPVSQIRDRCDQHTSLFEDPVDFGESGRLICEGEVFKDIE